jgi:hypothetical protein
VVMLCESGTGFGGSQYQFSIPAMGLLEGEDASRISVRSIHRGLSDAKH